MKVNNLEEIPEELRNLVFKINDLLNDHRASDIDRIFSLSIILCNYLGKVHPEISGRVLEYLIRTCLEIREKE